MQKGMGSAVCVRRWQGVGWSGRSPPRTSKRQERACRRTGFSIYFPILRGRVVMRARIATFWFLAHFSEKRAIFEESVDWCVWYNHRFDCPSLLRARAHGRKVLHAHARLRATWTKTHFFPSSYIIPLHTPKFFFLRFLNMLQLLQTLHWFFIVYIIKGL